jgi:hypothetical protein
MLTDVLTAGKEAAQDGRAVGGFLRYPVKDARLPPDLVIGVEVSQASCYLGQVYGGAVQRCGQVGPGLTGPNPCTGAAIVSVDASGTAVNHITFFPAGDEVWATFTETGKITVLDSNNVTYTGHLTVWGNFNMNEKNSNNTFTLTIMLTGSDAMPCGKARWGVLG